MRHERKVDLHVIVFSILDMIKEFQDFDIGLGNLQANLIKQRWIET